MLESAHKTQTYSRRRYSHSETRVTDPWSPRRRDIILFFAAMVLLALLLLVLSSHWGNLGLQSLSLSVWLGGVILLYVSLGFACLFGIAYFTTDIFIRREVDRRVKRKEEEHRALLQKMYGRTEEPSEEEDD